jgi:DNA replication protein DnaC
VPSCEICGDTSWKTITVDGVSRVTRCDCWKVKLSDTQLAQSRIPHKYRRCTLENFETHYDSHRRAAQKAQRFIDAFPVVDRGLLFRGSFGVGKTHLAVAMLKELIRKGARGYFYEVPELLRMVKDSYDANPEQDERQTLEPVLRADVLVLDDLGEERTSEWVQETLAHIINVRYSENRPTIITTGLTDSPDSSDPKSFVYKVGGRTRSRLIEMCEWVLMEAIDTREVGPDPTPEAISTWQDRSPMSPKNLDRTRKGGFPQKSSGQLKAKPRFGSGDDKGDLKWSGGKGGNR